MEKKDLYLAKNLDGLRDKYDVDFSALKKNSIAQILVSLKKLVEAAEKYKLEGDEEMSYCLYMKYMNLLTKIQKRPDYTREKALVGKMVGNNETIVKYLDTLEKLKSSLVERYDKKYPAQNAQPLAESTRVPDDFSESLSMTAIPKPRAEIRETITCKELYKMMEEGQKLLIMDCRPGNDYEQSKITYHYTINIPQHILTFGMTASKIQQQLPNESKVFWELRTSRSLIFMDWSSQRFNRNSPVWHLKEILLEWDEELEKKPEMLLLEGGYDFWKTHYPMKCNNPNFSPPNDLSGDAMGLDGIEYPNIDDIQMKDASLNKTQTPLVDRTMKLSAIKAYENNKTPLEILEEKDKLADRSLQNERELLNLETKIKDIVTDKENNEDSSMKEQSLMFQIWQLQSKQEDYSVEERTLKKQLEETKEQVKDTQERTKLMEVEEQLRQKENERKQIHEERERKRKEREEALRLARERKPSLNDHRTPPKTQRKDELILSPKALGNQVVAPSIPAFDRSSKPALNNTRYIYNEEDFSPVYARVERGLTGLKNLGNSCYMNSIIQCLSNTSTLAQYLLDSNYEKHLNRSNKTKGHIVRTLAAVIKMLWSGECKYISSKHLKAVIGEQDHLFYGTDQQDSHEFLIMLIDWLQSDLQTITVQSTIDSLPASERAWLEYTKARESFILRLFYGQIKSTVKCTVCANESATYETFSNLSLELPPNNIDRCHISECFNMYFHGEVVRGWNCPRCKEPREAIKKLDISKLPPVLVIHLKRFYADPYMNSTFRKKTIYVDFPLSDMNMMPYVARSEKNNGSNSQHVYNLYAVSNHYGSMQSGHYTAFCRNYGLKKWYKFDDHTVSTLDKSDVKSSATYILFYTSLPANETFIGGR